MYILKTITWVLLINEPSRIKIKFNSFTSHNLLTKLVRILIHTNWVWTSQINPVRWRTYLSICTRKSGRSVDGHVRGASCHEQSSCTAICDNFVDGNHLHVNNFSLVPIPMPYKSQKWQKDGLRQRQHSRFCDWRKWKREFPFSSR